MTGPRAHPRDADPSSSTPRAQDRDGELVGERLGNYLLIGELGFGGMAELFVAVQRGLQGFDKVVTVKRALPQLTRSQSFVNMFIDEARVCARLVHPNLVRTFELGQYEGQYFTVMEYLAGEEVGQLVETIARSDERLPVEIAASICAQVCTGLHHAHEMTDSAGRPLGLVHRDVNPKNVIVTYRGEVKVIDFGIALVDAPVQQTRSDAITGNVAYMAPEQIVARGVDRRSDVFSIGVVLWELITGAPLFARGSDAATLYAVMNDPIPSPSRYRPDVPAELEDILMRALARTPADRFETCALMADALELFLAERPLVQARTIAQLMTTAFGEQRAAAKQAIAQGQQLVENIPIVMRPRTGSAHVATLQPVAETAIDLQPPVHASRIATPVIAAVAAAGLAVAGVVGYMLLQGGDAPAPRRLASTGTASIVITSEPAGAAVSLGGEPTGTTTPATLTGLRPGAVELAVAHEGYVAAREQVQLTADGSITKHFVLAPSQGRLVLSGLPENATLLVDNEEHLPGEVIPLPGGAHDVQVLRDGATLVHQSITITSGDTTFEIIGGRLVQR